jgi:hypothetical protein
MNISIRSGTLRITFTPARAAYNSHTVLGTLTLRSCTPPSLLAPHNTPKHAPHKHNCPATTFTMFLFIEQGSYVSDEHLAELRYFTHNADGRQPRLQHTMHLQHAAPPPPSPPRRILTAPRTGCSLTTSHQCKSVKESKILVKTKFKGNKMSN